MQRDGLSHRRPRFFCQLEGLCGGKGQSKEGLGFEVEGLGFRAGG